jgi:heme exporter protein D
MDLGDFLHMGGYAGYVWTAYGLTEQRDLAVRRMNIDKENRT